MILNYLFRRFMAKKPLAVMTQALIEHVFTRKELNRLFDDNADQGYTRKLLFSTLIDLMSLLVLGPYKAVRTAFRAISHLIPVTLTAVYEKLAHLETQVAAALVRYSANRATALITGLQGQREPDLKGYRTQVLDGNHLAATEHRLKETRALWDAPLPGWTLNLLDPQLDLVTHVFPCEDGHAQERSLLDRVLEVIEAHDLVVADRNICTVGFLLGVKSRQACFVIRRHGSVTVEPLGAWSAEVATDKGWVSECVAAVLQDHQVALVVRYIRIRLKEPTQDGSPEVYLLSNVPTADATAEQLAHVYLKRRRVEDLFQELTDNLGCEVKTLCYPKAALLAYCVAVVAYNLLAVVRAALRAEHGEAAEELSGYYLALEMQVTEEGMLTALPAKEWRMFGKATTAEMVAFLRQVARKVDLSRYAKAPPRVKKKEPPKRTGRRNGHIATARILAQRKNKQSAAR
jgi:hypothetical protein